jgi:hypothetical protein
MSAAQGRRFELTNTIHINDRIPINQSILIDKTDDGGIDIIVSDSDPAPACEIYLSADQTRRLIAWLCGHESS